VAKFKAEFVIPLGEREKFLETRPHTIYCFKGLLPPAHAGMNHTVRLHRRTRNSGIQGMSRFLRFKSVNLWLWILMVSAGLAAFCLQPPQDLGASMSTAAQVKGILTEKLMDLHEGEASLCRKDVLCGPSAIYRFYENRSFEPAWTDDAGPHPHATILVENIRAADLHGLNPYDYHLLTIQTTLEQANASVMSHRPPDPELLADLDLLLTDAFLLYGSHLLSGRLNPEDVQSEWNIESREGNLPAILQAALDQNRIGSSLGQLAPQQKGYTALKQALQRYRVVLNSGGWLEIPSGPKMEMGYKGSRVGLLRSRLVISGDLENHPPLDKELYDETLDQAVRRFQRRHGLEPDGIVGSAILGALNAPTVLRVEQIRANLERWRWLPQDLGNRYVVVNIADFHLEMVENGSSPAPIRVVAGRPYRHTPVFSGTMTYLEINPYWHIPPRIASKDILPKVKRDPDYLAEQKIRVFENWNSDAREIDPHTIDWSAVSPRTFHYKLRQDPGSLNALGRIKFMFPNRFDVYLHDTPAKDLFEKTQRTFSSGCIRVERPIELAQFVLDGDSVWTPKAIQAAIESGQTQIVRLARPLPVHILYWTAWVDEIGDIQFREDVYGRDAKLREALNEPAPGEFMPPEELHAPW